MFSSPFHTAVGTTHPPVQKVMRPIHGVHCPLHPVQIKKSPKRHFNDLEGSRRLSVPDFKTVST
jgi:hypothetical protein